jgi:small-conductance mechanosensitive channel
VTNPWQWLRTTLNLNAELQNKLLSSLLIIFALWLLRLVTIFVVDRRAEDDRLSYRWRKTSAYIVVPLGILFLFWIWIEELQPLATFLGLVSAGVAVALRDPLVNLAGWTFILWRRPFEVGDRIQIGEYAGDVVDLRIFQFTILEIGGWVAADQSTGRVLHIPNGKVFSDALANYSKGFEFIWDEIPVVVTFESDWEKAKALLQDIVDRHAAHLSESAQQRIRRVARKFMIRYATLTPTVYTRVESNGVRLTLRYLCEPRQRRSSAQAIWEDVLRAFADHADVEFAYPTQRFYDHRRESSGPRADSHLDPESE